MTEQQPTREQIVDRMARATQMIADCFRVMEEPDKRRYVETLAETLLAPEPPAPGEALPAADREPQVIPCSDPEIQARAHEVLLHLWPNLTEIKLWQFADVFAATLKLGGEAKGAGRELTADLAGRIVAGFEFERARRGFSSYKEMAQTAIAVHRANMRDRQRDKQIN